MTIEEKISKTLAELGVTDAAGVEALFAEVCAAMEAERRALISQGAASEAERARLAKALRDRWLARKNGLVSQIDEHWLKAAPKELKPVVGREFNQLRLASAPLDTGVLIQAIRAGRKIAESLSLGASGAVSVEAAAAHPDLTLPGYRRRLGSIHPITRVQREIEDIFLGLGYSIETGPEVETTYYNFDALNIPATHPARDDMDSLYVDNGSQKPEARSQKSEVRSQNTKDQTPDLTPDTLHLAPALLLRTHTSPVQIRALRKHGAPLHILAPGKAYRRDNPDATHSPMFHQVEGLAVDTDITFADLKGTLDFFCRKFFGEKVRTSFHPTYFPFTEPSGEVSISCFVCEGRGSDNSGQICRTCKGSGWMEVMGCGMVHPEVLRAGGVDPERYSGWAFGLGIERFAMVKYDIHDIQLFFQSDMRFLEQFG